MKYEKYEICVFGKNLFFLVLVCLFLFNEIRIFELVGIENIVDIILFY